MKMILPFVVALTSCGSAPDFARNDPDTVAHAAVAGANTADPQQGGTGAERSVTAGGLPEKYLKAFTCSFDENPLVAAERYHGSPAGRAERARDLRLLRSLGFDRGGRDGDLDSTGGKIAAPPGQTILGLPVRFLELNGLIGDANAMYVTTFAAGVTVDQVVKAARLTLDRDRFSKYKVRQYSRRVGSNPFTTISLSDRNGPNAILVCQVQSTPH